MNKNRKIKNNKPKVPLKIDSSSIKYIIAYFSVVSAIELLAYGTGGIFSLAAAYIWFFTGIFWLGYFLFFAGKSLIQDIKSKNYFVMGAFLAVVAFFLLLIGNVSMSDINPDATQQVAAGLEAFDHSDLNYTGTAFIGYPCRQYIIVAIPAALFGRSIWTLHAGFGFMFLMGLTVFFLNVRKWLRHKGIKEEYALLPCFALLAFPFITEYYMNFEQAITPVSLTLIGIGLFLNLVMETDILSVLAISYVGCLMADSYTPVLASMGLLIVFLCIFAFRIRYPSNTLCRRMVRFAGEETDASVGEKNAVAISSKTVVSTDVKNKAEETETLTTTEAVFSAIIGCAVNIIAFFVATSVAGRSDRLTEFRESSSVIKTALDSWKGFFTDANVRFLGIFGGAVILYMLLSFILRFGIVDLLVSCWVLGVVFFSDYMTGYTAYEKCWVIQRNMIVIPVLIVFIFLRLMDFMKKHELSIKKPIQAVLLLFFLAAGFYNISQPHHSFRYFSYIQPMKYAIDYIEDTLKENGLKPTDRFSLVVYTENILQSNIHDYAVFLFPNATTYSESGQIYDSGIDTSLPCIILSEDDRIKYLEAENMEMYGNDSYLRFMKTKTESKTYKNKRYDSEITWYRKVMLP